MRFDSLSAFILMDGHGLYIWVAYGVTLVVIGVNFLWPRFVRRAFVRSARKAEARRRRSKP